MVEVVSTDRIVRTRLVACGNTSVDFVSVTWASGLLLLCREYLTPEEEEMHMCDIRMRQQVIDQVSSSIVCRMLSAISFGVSSYEMCYEMCYRTRTRTVYPVTNAVATG